MAVITERGRAKINLTLRVLGRRADGYHELESLVAFADVGDVVTLDTDVPARDGRTGWDVTISGPFAAALTAGNVGGNLIAMTLQRLADACPALRLGAVHLNKQLPVASGLGGGSADAAAVLRAVRRANADNAASQHVSWERIAASLGADVPVCFANRSAWMQGIGNRLQPVPGLPEFHAVLVNALPTVPPDKTARVFRALNAAPLAAVAAVAADAGAGDNGALPAALHELGLPGAARTERYGALLAFMRNQGNSLSVATQEVVPELKTVLSGLYTLALGSEGAAAAAATGSSAVPAPESAMQRSGTNRSAPSTPQTSPVVAMSGAGPTCFIAVPSAAHATNAAAALRIDQPTWWVAATRLGCDDEPSD
jgi:4-diphosphocytidyl-2-C-methyl-D-erythritol kinase